MTAHHIPAVLSDGDWARHPQSLAIEAYFDGWAAAIGAPRAPLPRIPTADELECWRDGWNEAKAERALYGDAWTVNLPGLPANVTAFRPRRRECRACPVLAVAA